MRFFRDSSGWGETPEFHGEGFSEEPQRCVILVVTLSVCEPIRVRRVFSNGLRTRINQSRHDVSVRCLRKPVFKLSHSCNQPLKTPKNPIFRLLFSLHRNHLRNITANGVAQEKKHTGKIAGVF